MLHVFGLPSSLSKWPSRAVTTFGFSIIPPASTVPASCRTRVSWESLYGTWGRCSARASITLPGKLCVCVCASALHANGIRSGKKSEANFRHNKNWRRTAVVLHDAFESYTATFRAKPLHTLKNFSFELSSAFSYMHDFESV